MPLYVYDCLDCERQISIRHSYKDSDVKCTLCESKNIKKNLSNVLRMTKAAAPGEEKTGSQVKKAIEDGKKELEEHKKKQQKRVYKKK
jgi:putative FmdB family regulatory protein